MSDETKKPMIAIDFEFISLQPDRRQYKPSNPLLQPRDTLIVVVDVPLDHEHIKNATAILTAQLSGKEGKDEPKPNLTPLGMKFIVDAFEAVMSDPEPEAEKSDDDLEWEDEKTSGETWEDTSTEPEKVAWEEDETETTSDEEDVTWEDDEDEPEAEDKSDAEDLEWDEEDL